MTQPFTLAHFYDWLNEQDPLAEYDINSVTDCLICRYGLANGVGKTQGGACFTHAMSPWRDAKLSSVINSIAYSGNRHTIAQAITTMEELMEDFAGERRDFFLRLYNQASDPFAELRQRSAPLPSEKSSTTENERVVPFLSPRAPQAREAADQGAVSAGTGAAPIIGGEK